MHRAIILVTSSLMGAVFTSDGVADRSGDGTGGNPRLGPAGIRITCGGGKRCRSGRLDARRRNLGARGLADSGFVSR